jgi:glycosyltransferase involved in cell wall biosynthesis
MNILHVIPNPFFFERGGLIRAYRQIALAREHGFQCQVVCYHLGRDIPEAVIHRIPAIPWYRNYAPGANVQRLYLDALLMMATLRAAKKFKPDIIHAHLHEGVFASLPLARRLNIPLLFDAEGSLSGEMSAYGFFGAALFKIIERYLNRQSDFILTSSKQLFDTMRTRFNVPRDRIVLFEDHINTKLFFPRDPDPKCQEQFAIPAGAPVVLYFGSLDRLQGLDILLNVAKIVASQVPQTHFLIMGFPDEKTWEDRFKRAGVLNSHFPGMIRRTEAAEYLSLGTVAVSAKRTGSSQGNGKLLDYMAMGLPVVAFDSGVNRDILGEWGAYAPDRDVDRFAESVLDLLRNPEARRKAGEGLRKRVCDNFSSQTHGDKLLDIYASIVKGDASNAKSAF